MKETTHDRVIKAAVKVMSEVGYHGMFIGILAKLVGVSKSTAIQNFKTKEGILLAVLENFLPYYSVRRSGSFGHGKGNYGYV